MKTYEHYKPSGVEWVGEIPRHWEVKKIKYSTDFNGSTLSEKPIEDFSIKYIDIGSVNGLGQISKLEEMLFSTAPSRARRIVKSGDTIISTVRTYLKAIAHVSIEDQNLICSTGFAVLSPALAYLDSRYLSYSCRSEKIIDRIGAYSKGVSYPAIDSEELKNFEIWIPPLDEQTAIADYLDAQTAQIDELVAKKRRLIELLQEERAGLINEAVTKGLNPAAARKDSGLPWLGEIPAHWAVKKLKYVAKIISGAAFDSTKFTKTGSVKVLKISNIQHGYVDWSETEYVPDTFAIEYENFKVENGDILFALTRPIISTGLKSARAYFTTDDTVLLNQRNAIMRAKYIDTDFLYYITLGKYFFGKFEVSIDTTGQQPNISPISIMNFDIYFPSEKEQKIIVDFLKIETTRIEATIKKIEQEIELMDEYRSALISEAVTGKINVL